MYGEYTVLFQDKWTFLKMAAKTLHLRGPKHATKERLTQLISMVVKSYGQQHHWFQTLRRVSINQYTATKPDYLSYFERHRILEVGKNF